MGLLTGLLPFEMILLLVGVVLFLVSGFVVVLRTRKQQDAKALLGLFVVSVVLIAFPAIKKLQFGEWAVRFNGAQVDYASNPDDPATRDALTKAAERADTRRFTEAAQFEALVRAHAVLGNRVLALNLAHQAINGGKATPALEKLESDLTIRPLPPRDPATLHHPKMKPRDDVLDTLQF